MYKISISLLLVLLKGAIIHATTLHNETDGTIEVKFSYESTNERPCLLGATPQEPITLKQKESLTFYPSNDSCVIKRIIVFPVSGTAVQKYYFLGDHFSSDAHIRVYTDNNQNIVLETLP